VGVVQTLKNRNTESLTNCCGTDNKTVVTIGIDDVQTLNTEQLVYMAIQVTKAVQYLHRHHIVHRDIATRNCVWGTRDSFFA